MHFMLLCYILVIDFPSDCLPSNQYIPSYASFTTICYLSHLGGINFGHYFDKFSALSNISAWAHVHLQCHHIIVVCTSARPFILYEFSQLAKSS